MNQPIEDFLKSQCDYNDDLVRTILNCIVDDYGIVSMKDLQSYTEKELVSDVKLKPGIARRIWSEINSQQKSQSKVISTVSSEGEQAEPILLGEEFKEPLFVDDYEIRIPDLVEENKTMFKIDTSAKKEVDEDKVYQIPTKNIKEEIKIAQINTQKARAALNHVAASTYKPKRGTSIASDDSSSSQAEFAIYSTYEDSSSEYKMSKIRLEEENFQKLIKSIEMDQVQIVGFFGQFEGCIQLAEKFIEKKVLIKEDIEEGVFILKHNNKLAMVSKTNEKIFKYTNGSDFSHLFCTYLRFLVDICEKVYFVAPTDFQINPDSKNPFQTTKNPGFKLEEQVLMPSDKVSVKEISCADEKIFGANLAELKSFGDNSKLIQKVDFYRDERIDPMLFSINSRDIINEKGSYNCSYTSKYEYEDVKRQIKEKWVLDGYFFESSYNLTRFYDSFITVVKPFVKTDKEYEFKAILKQMQDEYLERSSNLRRDLSLELSDLLEPLNQNFMSLIFENQCDRYKNELEQLKLHAEPESIATKIKKVFVSDEKKNETRLKCSHKCKDETISWIKSYYQYRMKFIDWESLGQILYSNSKTYLKLHHTFSIEGELKKLDDHSNEIKNNFGKKRQEKFTVLRKDIVNQLFDKIDDFIVQFRHSATNEFTIQFNAINIIRNTEHQVQNFNINKTGQLISHKFTSKESQGTIQLRSIQMVNENTGLALFSNTPDGKSAIYFFSFPSKTQVTFQHNMNISSIDSFLIIEPGLKQWFIYDNHRQIASLGKLTSQGKIEEGIPVSLYGQINEGQKVEQILSACFLPYGDKILFLNQNHQIMEYRWQSKQLYSVFKKVNKDESGVQKVKIEPANHDDKYQSIQALSDGKTIVLKSRTSIDLYDLNWDKIYTFSIDHTFNFFKIFTDKINDFILISTKEGNRCFQLVGTTATKTFNSEVIPRGSESKSLGNPFLDYFYLCFNKFGPHSEFIGCPEQTKLVFYQQEEVKFKDKLQKYFKALNIPMMSLEFQSERTLENREIASSDESFLGIQKLKMILLSRIAIHVATIENFTLVPLRNGVNVSDEITESLLQSKDRSTDIIEKIIDLIKFGIYEKALQEIKENLYVVSIVGRQSSGKSYVMNRFFGTRFNVASTRCTDGIWMSIVQLYEDGRTQYIVVLDCEGLFSARRNEQEEIKLCLTLSALSDILILNQDLSFNRYLNQLFNNFSKSIGRIKGKQLFKGCLMMLVRDVQEKEAEGAYKELKANFMQLQSKGQDTFLRAVFQGKLISQCLNYFELPIFKEEIEISRTEYFLGLKHNRWLKGSDFAESLKIVLAQVLSDDDTDIDVHKVRLSCEQLFQQALTMYFDGGEHFKGPKSILLQDFEINGTVYKLNINQKEIKLQKEFDEFGDSESTTLTQEILEKFCDQTTMYSLETHNSWLIAFSQYIDALLQQRQDYIISLFKESLPKDKEFTEIIQSYEYKLKNIFDTYAPKVKFCKKTCRNCKRICNLHMSHTKDCNCSTSHICEMICDKTEECKKNGYICVEVFGHPFDHRCNEGNHKCSYHCQILDCKYLCSQEAGHTSELEHNCGNKHPCSSKCADDFCTRTCQFDNTVEHSDHICGETHCIHKCQISGCERKCIFPDHLHQKHISEEDEEKLNYEHEGKMYNLNYHVCGEIHDCKEKCDEEGVCQVEYKIEEKIWKNEFGETPYNYFNPLEARTICRVMIPEFCKEHKESHDCKIGSHRCSHQCPECQSFCKKDIGHEGRHMSKAHRNKEHSVFVSEKGKEKVEILVEGKKREYKIGESCQPEFCNLSCARKGRAHYHLVECKGEDECAAKINPFVKHATEKFHPFVDKVFDKWLCTNYWNSKDWEPPCEGEQLEEIQSCNFICCHPSHGDLADAEKRSFCTKSAWHIDEHAFDCEHKGSYSTNIIDIVFCVDSTGSMGCYINKSKDTISRIIKDVQELSKDGERSIKFAFVTYRDHPPQDNTYASKYQNFCDESTLKAYIETVTASGGGDGPESVMDGLYDSVFNLSWRKDSMRYLFHIADAPPHGTEYTGGSGDGFPSGCPCGHTIDKIAEGLKANAIKYKLLKIGSYPNTMASVFKRKIDDYEESDLDSAVQLELKVTGILVRDIKSDEADIMMH